MQAEVTTKLKLTEGILVLSVNLLPRGSGNRNAARRLAKQFKDHAELGPHIEKVTAGASRVVVQLRVSVQLYQIINSMKIEQERDVPGQLLMHFGSPA